MERLFETDSTMELFIIQRGVLILYQQDLRRNRSGKNKERFDILLHYVHTYKNSKYVLYDNNGKFVEVVYDTDYESDNGLDEDEEGYEEYQCIAFKRIDNGNLLEVNYQQIPIKVICDGANVY